MRFPFQLLTANDFDVVGFGTNAVDYLIRVPEYPPFNSKIELSTYSQAAGGEIASSMVGLSRLGLNASYAGRFGGDHAGEIGIRSLTDEGVNITYAETVTDALTQVAFILIDETTGERTVIWQRDAKLAYAAADAPVAAAVRGRVLHMTPHDTAACITMAKAAKAKGVVVSLDVDNVFDGIEDLLPLVDVCISSADLPEKLLGISDQRAALGEMSSRYGCAVIGLTLGGAGSIFRIGEKVLETPGFDVPGGCVDTTGAGDAFRTGFLFGLLTGEDIEGSARVANAVAALKCRGVGARSSLPFVNELQTMLKNV